MSSLRSLVKLGAVFVASVLPSSTTASQQADAPTEVAEHERAAIVWEVLAARFEPVEKPTVVPLSMAGLEIAWIPAIPNVEFVPLDADEVARADEACEPYYYFDNFVREKRSIRVALGHGTRYRSSGDLYTFRYRKGRLEIDGRRLGGFGRVEGHAKCP